MLSLIVKNVVSCGQNDHRLKTGRQLGRSEDIGCATLFELDAESQN